ncbi:MAG: hypothetical protein PHQ65_17185 [Bacteroidales bacterium]|nr:hypothetical protein [Bacteroidales bacterium]
MSNDRQEIITIKPNVWYNIYQDTIKENILIWEKIVNTIKKKYPNSTIHVIVFPNNPIFIENHMEAILKMKNIFYENIFLENVEIILKDCFNMSYKHEDFEDYCHLQGKKSIEFSQYLSIYFKELLFSTSFC